VIASIVFLAVCVTLFGRRQIEPDPVAYVVASGFLIMVIQCVVNLYIFSKHFPDKILSGSKLTWHIVATVFNFIAFCGLCLVTLSGLVVAFDPSDPNALMANLLIVLFTVITLIIAFLLYCQLTLNRYLNKRNNVLVDALIDSIGKSNN
jgi:hypothetical protein